MQKIVNIIAIASGVVSLSVVGGGVYLYTQKDAIIESVTQKALGSIGLRGGLGSAGGVGGSGVVILRWTTGDATIGGTRT